MKRGVPPTALNARTGEFTPPGMTAQASSNSFDETSVCTCSSVPAAGSSPTTGCSCCAFDVGQGWLHGGRRQYGAKGERRQRQTRKPPFLGFDGGGFGVDRHLDVFAA